MFFEEIIDGVWVGLECDLLDTVLWWKQVEKICSWMEQVLLIYFSWEILNILIKGSIGPMLRMSLVLKTKSYWSVQETVYT